MKTQFFPTSKTVGFVRSGEGGHGPCLKATNNDLATFIPKARLDTLSGLVLKAGELTDREVQVMSYELYCEIRQKLGRYSRMRRQETGEDAALGFCVNAGALEDLYKFTAEYERKNEVFQQLAESLREEAGESGAELFGEFTTPPRSMERWEHHPRAPLEQDNMTTPTDVLCGIARLEKQQPHFLVRAGALWPLANGRNTGRRKRLVAQRVGETLCVANSRYDGPLNLNSEGLQLERLLCGQPQYLEPGTPDFEAYATKEVFLVKEVALPSGKQLCTYYHAYGRSTEGAHKGRVQVDSAEQPWRYRLRTGAEIKETVIQMWARDQRYLHHTEWDRAKEYVVVRVPVREVRAASQPDPGLAGETSKGGVVPWDDIENPEDESNNVPFEEGWIRLRIRNNNKIVSRPLGLDECLDFDTLAGQAFSGQEATEAQNRIIGNLDRIAKALDAREAKDGTEDKWSSYAYYLDKAKMEGEGAENLDVFDERWGVSYKDRLVPQIDGLHKYKEVVHPEYVRNFTHRAASTGTGGSAGKGRAGGRRGGGSGKSGHGANTSSSSGAGKGKARGESGAGGGPGKNGHSTDTGTGSGAAGKGKAGGKNGAGGGSGKDGHSTETGSGAGKARAEGKKGAGAW